MCKIHLQCHVGSALKEFHRCSRKKNVKRNNAMDDKSVRQPSWLPRYTTETRKPAAPVSKVNAAHRECCHCPAPPDPSSSPPIVRLSHPLPPFFECVGGKKWSKSPFGKTSASAPLLAAACPGRTQTSLLSCHRFTSRKKKILSDFAPLTSKTKPCGSWSQMHLRMEAELEG